MAPFIALAVTLLSAVSPPQVARGQDEPGSRRLTQLRDERLTTLPDRSRRYALVIGIDRYTSDANIASLKGAANDAKAIAEALVKYADFDRENVVVLTSDEADTTKQPTRMIILRTLKNMKSYIEPGGMLVVAFSGHGVERQSDHKVFLLPADASSNPEEWEETALAVERIKELITQTSAGQVMLLLDAFRNDPTAGRSISDNKLTKNYLDAFRLKNNSLKAFVILSAASEGQRAWEYQEKKQGYFSWAFVEGLKGAARDPNTGKVTLGHLVEYVTTEVPRLARFSGREQRPYVEMEGYGMDLVISDSAPPKAPPLARPTPSLTAGVLSIFSEPGAQLVIEPASGGKGWITKATLPADQRVFTSEPLAFGVYRVTASREGYLTETREVVISATQLRPVLDLMLKSITYDCTVKTNLAEGQVEFGQKDGPRLVARLEGGKVVLKGLRPGSYEVRVVPEDVAFRPKSDTVEVNGDLTLEYKLEAQPPARPVNEATLKPAPPIANRYHALVVGSNVYKHLPRLLTAENDAKTLEAVLKEKFGFETRLLLNATRSQIFAELYKYRRELGADSNLLIYYAGHGYYDREVDKAYWLPVDATKEDGGNWISADDITTLTRGIAAQHILIVSDSCYSGTISRGIKLGTITSAQRERYLQRMNQSKSRMLLASGGNEPVADDGPGGHSVFANALLRGLNQMGGSVFTGEELYHKYLREAVAGGSAQVPEYNPLRNSGHEGGDFVFNFNLRSTIRSSPAKAPAPRATDSGPRRARTPSGNSKRTPRVKRLRSIIKEPKE
ncbi:MAG TPA: caspase family protein [Pyrinomonadaceae bacterium]